MIDSWLVIRRNKMVFHDGAKQSYWYFKWFSKSPFMRCSSICPEVLNISQIAAVFHKTRPPCFIQAWLQRYCRSPFFYSAYCSFTNTISRRGVDAQWYYDKSWQDLPNKWHSAFPTARETFINSLPFPEKFSFYKDQIVSTEWLDSVPHLRIGDCFEIHLPHWGLCDLLFSSHQTFLLEVLLRQCVFCKEPFSSWFASIRRNFDLLGSK